MLASAPEVREEHAGVSHTQSLAKGVTQRVSLIVKRRLRTGNVFLALRIGFYCMDGFWRTQRKILCAPEI